jgi:hypothetical protein
VLENARQLGVKLSTGPDGKLLWRSQKPLPDALKAQLVANKGALVALLSTTPKSVYVYGTPESPEKTGGFVDKPSWEQTEAAALVARVQERRRQLYDASQWPADRDGRHRLAAWMDAFDAAYLARDLAALRRLLAEFPTGPGPAISQAEEEAVLRVIERDQGLSSGGLAFYSVANSDKNQETKKEKSPAAARGTPEVNLPFPDAPQPG